MNKIKSTLQKSIIATMLAYTLFQIIFILIFQIITATTITFITLSLIANLIFHSIIFISLYKSPELFVTIPENIQLKKINLANMLTLFRLSAVPNIISLILIQGKNPNNKLILRVLIIYIIVAFITDFFDGAISRKRKECTKLGSVMDSASDYLVLFVITVVFFLKEIMGPLLFSLIILRGLAISISGLSYWFHSKTRKIETTFMGKVSVFAAMTIIAIETTKLLSFPRINQQIAEAIRIGLNNFVYIMEWIACAILIISILDKLWLYLGRIFRIIPKHPVDRKTEKKPN